MTVVNVRLFESALGGASPVPVGFVRAEPFAGLVPRVDVSADVVTLPRPLLVHVSDGDPQVSIDLEPTGPAWLWRITVGVQHGPQLVRHVSVPGSPVPVAFADLIDVDPYTMGPAPEQVPGWKALLEEISTALMAVRVDRVSAEGAAVGASASASAAAGSRAAAQDYSAEARKDAEAASASAISAESAAAAASRSRVQAESDAVVASTAVAQVRSSASLVASLAESAGVAAGAAASSAGTAVTAAAAATSKAAESSASASAAAKSVITAQSHALFAWMEYENMIKKYGQRETVSGVYPVVSVDPGVKRLVLSGDTTVVLPVYPADGVVREIDLHLIQDAVGGRSFVVKGAATAYAVPIAVAPGPGARSVVRCVSEGEGWDAYLAASQLGVAAGWVGV